MPMSKAMGMIQYEMGIKLFEQNRYGEAVQCFCEAYEAGVYQEDIIEIIYSCFINPNAEEFKKNYEKQNEGISTLNYEDLPIDFIFVAEDIFYLFDREARSFLGKFHMQPLRAEYEENEFNSLLIADVWDIRAMLPMMQEKNWRNVYLILGEQEKYFASFLKIPGFREKYLQDMTIFVTEVAFEQYFKNNKKEYLPRAIFANDNEKYLRIINRIHDDRVHEVPEKNSEVFLSICIPSYERGDIALRNVQHILESEYDAELEIIVSNNGSKKNVEGYEQIKQLQDSRIVYYEFEENQGYASNVRNVLGLARGKFAVLTSDEDTMILGNLGRYMQFLSNMEQIGVITSEMCEMDATIVGEAVTHENGFEAIKKAYGLNYITGITFNMKKMTENHVFERFDATRGNLYVEYYAHAAMALFASENIRVVESKISMWRTEKEDDIGTDLLSYMKLESRIGQLNATIDFFNENMEWEKDIRIKMCLFCMGRIYYLMSIARETRKKAFDVEYLWGDICERIHVNNQKIVQEKMMWCLPGERERVAKIVEKMYEDYKM